MRYEVRTLSSANRIGTLSLEATDEQDVHRQLAAQALKAVAIRRLETTPSRRLSGVAKRFSLLLFSQELLALLKAGLSLIEAVEALLEKETSNQVQTTLSQVLVALREGKRLSTALQAQPSVFPPLYVGLVQASEETSNLPHSLSRYIAYQQRADSVRSKIISASIYPVILMLVGGAVTLFLICYVVPKFSVVYQGTGRDLPWLSQQMLYWGRLLSEHTGLALGGVAALGVAIVLAVRQSVRARGIGQLLTRLPTVGSYVRLYELSRLYMTLGMLLDGGIPIVPALQTVGAASSQDTHAKLAEVQRQIQAGRPLSAAFESACLTTSISLRMLRVGERSGQLGAMLEQAAEFYEGDVSRFIDRFTRTFEPLLMALIGMVVGLIVVLLYMPIFDLAGSLQ